MRRRTASTRQVAERDVAERDAAVVAEAAEPVGDRRRLVRAAPRRGTSAGPARRRGPSARRRAARPAAARRPARAGSATVALDREHVEHPPGADERARHLVDRLGRRPQRDDEEGGVPVERDELADADLPREREARADPRRRARRRARARRPARRRASTAAARRGRPPAAPPASCRGSGRRTPARRRSRAARAGRRRCRRRARSASRPPRAARAAAPAAARSASRAGARAPARRAGRRSPSTTEDESRMTATTTYETTAPDEPRGDVERAARAHRVVRDRRDDLAGREPAADRRPRAGGVVRDDLREPERRLEPVDRRRTRCRITPATACSRAEAEQDAASRARAARLSLVDDPVLDRAPDRERHQRLRRPSRRSRSRTPATSVGTWCRPTQTSSRTGERVSGSPGSANGKLDHGCSMAWCGATPPSDR